METASKNMELSLSMKTREIIFDVITYLFISLFIYTATSKIIKFDLFIAVLGKSPLLGNINHFIGYTIPIAEILISGTLLINRTKKLGLILSLILMIIFTIYLVYMISLGEKLPCSCGGVLSSMSWRLHVWFNLLLIILASFGLIIYRNRSTE